MPKAKIIGFPHPALNQRPVHGSGSDCQLDLFGHDCSKKGKVVFVDISWLSEETLLTLVIRNDVTAVVDIRSRPVFQRPKFQHKNVVHYFYTQNIEYLEYAFLVRDAINRTADSFQSLEQAADKIGALLGRGLTICIYDEAARSTGALDEVRRLVRRATNHLAEVNPRALVGLAGIAPGGSRDS